jgi:hypothetical protein
MTNACSTFKPSFTPARQGMRKDLRSQKINGERTPPKPKIIIDVDPLTRAANKVMSLLDHNERIALGLFDQSIAFGRLLRGEVSERIADNPTIKIVFAGTQRALAQKMLREGGELSSIDS